MALDEYRYLPVILTGKEIVPILSSLGVNKIKREKPELAAFINLVGLLFFGAAVYVIINNAYKGDLGVVPVIIAAVLSLFGTFACLPFLAPRFEKMSVERKENPYIHLVADVIPQAHNDFERSKIIEKNQEKWRGLPDNDFRQMYKKCMAIIYEISATLNSCSKAALISGSLKIPYGHIDPYLAKEYLPMMEKSLNRLNIHKSDEMEEAPPLECCLATWEGEKFFGNKQDKFGEYGGFWHDCPKCGGIASTGRTIVWAILDIHKKGAAKFSCKSCGARLQISKDIFDRGAFQEVVDYPGQRADIISEMKIDHLLVDNWEEVLLTNLETKVEYRPQLENEGEGLCPECGLYAQSPQINVSIGCVACGSKMWITPKIVKDAQEEPAYCPNCNEVIILPKTILCPVCENHLKEESVVLREIERVRGET